MEDHMCNCPFLTSIRAISTFTFDMAQRIVVTVRHIHSRCAPTKCNALWTLLQRSLSLRSAISDQFKRFCHLCRHVFDNIVFECSRRLRPTLRVKPLQLELPSLEFDRRSRS